jgi:hypothetical protein
VRAVGEATTLGEPEAVGEGLWAKAAEVRPMVESRMVRMIFMTILFLR